MRKCFRSAIRVNFALALLLFFTLQAFAQSNNPVPARITAQVDGSNLVVLKGNTHPLAQAKYDQGMAPDSLPAERMLMVLQRSPQQEVALRALIDGQQSKSSGNYHQWLTPEQFGQQFGVADADIEVVTSWLQSQGFQVNRVAASKMLIEFSGTAGAIRNAFHTEIHKYVVNGQEHWANASDPSIPAALAPVVAGVNTMNNFRPKAAVHAGRALPMPKSSVNGNPQFTVAGCNINEDFSNPIFNNTCFGLGPADFAKIYNVPASFDGTGQTIAIVGDSDICTIGTNQAALPAGCVADDVVAFRNLFGLPANHTQVLIDGQDPGINVDGDEIEGALDVEWAGAVAKNATILYVIAADTETSNGVDLAAERIVDNNLAPILTESYGACESALGNAGNEFYATLWEQAAAQGITAVLATGDAGSAMCDINNGIATQGPTVSGYASTPFTVSVGGTDFNYNAANYVATYWNSTNNASTGLSVKSYVPETSWNDTCGQSTFGNCTDLSAIQQEYLLGISGGGGGQSGCAFVSGIECYGYETPPWQTGVGVPTTGFRYIPDVSLFASDGELSNSFYVECESDLVSPAPSCTTTGNSEFIPVGGTSASAQVFGGIMALVNQAMVASSKSGRQGDANYMLYPLFANQTTANLSCNSSASPAGNCTFNDITNGTNTVFCAVNSADCFTSTETLTLPNSTDTALTSTPAYATTTGFDEATGLGSVNVTNLITNWVNETADFASTTTSLCMSTSPTVVTSCNPGTPFTFMHGTKIYVNAAVTSGGGTVSGDVALIGTGSFPSFPPNTTPTSGVDHFNATTGNSDIYNVVNGLTPSGAYTTELIGGSYTITAHFPGSNAGGGLLFGVSDSPGIVVDVTPEPSTSTVNVVNTNAFTGGAEYISSAASVPYGSGLAIRVDVCSTASASGSPAYCSIGGSEEDGTGIITITDTGASTNLPSANVTLNSEGYAEFFTPLVNYPGNLLPANATGSVALNVGSHSFKASFPGDPSYQASSSPSGSPFALTVTQAPTYPAIVTGPSSVSPNAAFNVTALVDTSASPLGGADGSIGNAPTGTVTFFNGTTQIGSPVPVTATFDSSGVFVAATATSPSISLTSSASLTAKYNGDGNYVTSTSPAFSVSVNGAASFSLSNTVPNPTSVTLNPGQTGMSVITISATNGFTGTVNLACSVSPSNLTDPPTCSMSAASVTLTSTTTSGTSTVSIFTTAASGLPVGPPLVQPQTPIRLLLISAFAMLLVTSILLMRFSSFRKRYGYAAVAIVLLTLGFAIVGCGGSSSGGGGGGGGNPGTTGDSYTVTITGTSGATSQSVAVTANVN